MLANCIEMKTLFAVQTLLCFIAGFHAGVGQYDASQLRIEAEDYFDADKVEIRECPAGGFEVRGLGVGSRLVYPNVRNLPANATIAFRVASGNAAGGTIEIHEGTAQGNLLGTCAVSGTGGWQQYRTVSCALTSQPGTGNFCLIFKGGEGELMRLDWLGFPSNAQ